jgi:hypothetical protein
MKDLKTGAYIGKMYVQFTQNGEFIQKTGEGKEQVVSKMTYRLGRGKIYYKGKATSNEEFDSNILTKPYYLIEFSAAACLFEIRVNDIPVMTLELSGQLQA